MTQAKSTRRVMRLPEVKQLVGLGRSAIYVHIANGTFPAPVKLSDDGRAVGWDSWAVEEWINKRFDWPLVEVK